ncbi:MAG: ABC transporter substrate-binding protein [Fastidiosipilaceae bacterium]|jgi:peptide/nickel transport system substrate-binding protein
MKKTLKRLISFAALISLLSTAGCGGGKPSDPTAGSTRESVVADLGEPLEGGEVIVAVTQEPDSLDPYLAEAAGTKEIIYNLFEGLVRLEPDGTFSPSLAESFEIAADGRSYEFKLRKGVLFHNGEEMTAQDVIYSLERGAGLLADEPTALIPEFKVIEEIVSDDAGETVTLKLKQPDLDLLGFLTQAIIPAGYTEQNSAPIGTGPFKFVEYKTQRHIVMEKFDDYSGAHPSHLDQVTFKIVPSTDAAMVDLQAGNIDLFPYLTMDKASLVEADYDLIETQSNMVQLWALNNEVAPFDDPNVRKALNLAIDKQLVIDTVTYGYGTLLESGMSPAMGDYYNDTLNPEHEFDREEAKRLLSAAGYENGLTLDVTVPVNYMIHVQTAEALAAQLAEVGVVLNVKPVDWGTWLNNVYMNREYQSTVIALTFQYSPSSVLGRYESAAPDNFINFANERYDEIWSKTVTGIDQQERVEGYRDLQQILYDDSASVFLQDPALLTAVKKELGGYTTYPLYVQDMSAVYYKK